MGTIFCIMGKSGSGKDTVFRELLRDKELRLKPYVPYTTRPMRAGETNGKEYYFLRLEQMEQLQQAGKIIEMREYDTVKGKWYYCTVDDGQFAAGGNYLLITTLSAYMGLRRYFGKDKVSPIYLEVDDGVRLERALRREKLQADPDYAELCRRFLADCTDFSAENLHVHHITQVYPNDRLSECLCLIRRDILQITTKDANL